MNKYFIILGISVLFISVVGLSGYLDGEDKQKSEVDKFIGTWGEVRADVIVGNVTFYKNETGTSHSTDVFTEVFNYSISNGKLYITSHILEEYQVTFEYYFSDDDKILNLRNTFGGATTVYKQQ